MATPNGSGLDLALSRLIATAWGILILENHESDRE